VVVAEKMSPSGGWLVSAMVKSRYESGWFYYRRQYYGYSKRDAVASFRDSLTRDGFTIRK
jgi:hypothetical protein